MLSYQFCFFLSLILTIKFKKLYKMVLPSVLKSQQNTALGNYRHSETLVTVV